MPRQEHNGEALREISDEKKRRDETRGPSRCCTVLKYPYTAAQYSTAEHSRAQHSTWAGGMGIDDEKEEWQLQSIKYETPKQTFAAAASVEEFVRVQTRT